jgi:hypothetical protein
MKRGFQILQANLRKIREVQMSLLNDGGLRAFDLLLIQEPHCWRIDGEVVVVPQHHNYWTQYKPTVSDDTHQWPFRSMVWARRDLPVRQIDVTSPDITAILIELGHRKFLVMSVYMPARENAEDSVLGFTTKNNQGNHSFLDTVTLILQEI